MKKDQNQDKKNTCKKVGKVIQDFNKQDSSKQKEVVHQNNLYTEIFKTNKLYIQKQWQRTYTMY